MKARNKSINSLNTMMHTQRPRLCDNLDNLTFKLDKICEKIDKEIHKAEDEEDDILNPTSEFSIAYDKANDLLQKVLFIKHTIDNFKMIL